MSTKFIATFQFSSRDPNLANVLHHMKQLIFGEGPHQNLTQRIICAYYQDLTQLNKPIYCWKVDSKELDEDEDPHSIQIKETIGERVVQDEPFSNTMPKFREPLKVNKNNISSQEELKMEIIGDYWD